MAIGSVKELIDYETETIKIVQKHGGGGGTVDLSLIADEYDETHQYPANDMVLHNNKLYKSTTAVNTPGRFDETMWNHVANYDESLTYNTGDYAVKQVEGLNRCFRCDEDNVTGEWDASKWTDVSETDFPAYTHNSGTYYPNYSKVSITMANPQLEPPTWTDYYIANSTYAPTGGAGEWNSAKWSETTVENVIKSITPNSATIFQFTTDADGCVWLNSESMYGISEPYNIKITHDSAFNGYTGRIEVVHKYENYHDVVGFKFYDGEGNVRSNWSSASSLGMTASIMFKY